VLILRGSRDWNNYSLFLLRWEGLHKEKGLYLFLTLMMLTKFLKWEDGVATLMNVNLSGRENFVGKFPFDMAVYMVGSVNWFLNSWELFKRYSNLFCLLSISYGSSSKIRWIEWTSFPLPFFAYCLCLFLARLLRSFIAHLI